MVYNITYRRPSFRPRSHASKSGEEKQRSIQESIDSASSSSGSSHGIPEALSFDRIIAGGVCPPCTVRDFMNYLKYIEHAAENLQFFLWYRDYVRRFDALPESEKTLAPEWTIEQAEAEALAAQTQPHGSAKVNAVANALFKGTDFESRAAKDVDKTNPFYTPPRTPSSESKRGDDVKSSGDQSTYGSKSVIQKKAEGAFEDAGLKWQPFSIQPYRKEVERIITVYIAEGSPRELNLSSKERTSLLHALENTTHPSAFHSVLTTIEWSLRCQSHPNFIRWAICNGNRPRVIFARGLGLSTIFLGLAAAILLTLSGAGRAWRVLSFVGLMIGTATLIAAWKGMCVVLHGMHHRHVRPWELFADADDVSEEIIEPKKPDDDYSKASFGSSNSFEDEPWVARYERRNVVRKVFDREVWIKEPALRQIQDTIFLQALLGAFVVSAVSVGVFCALPAGNFY